MTINDGFPKKMIFDRKLNEEELELLRREYQKILSIGKMKMDSIAYQLFLDKNNEVLLPRGTLIYGIEADLNILEYISKNGILAPEFLGKYEVGETYYCVYFDRVDSDTLLRNYDITYTPNEKMPFNEINNNIAFVINSTSKIGGLLYYDLLDSKFDNNPIVKNIINRKFILEYNKGKNSAILAGVPSNAISGIILGDEVLLNDDLILEIKKLFPNAYLVTRDGKIIKDRSNIIKIEDYEGISLKYSKETVKVNKLHTENIKLQKENDKLKKNLLDYINAVRNNTTPFEQASILLAIGYKVLPPGLKSKLSDEDLSKLKIQDDKINV